MRKCKKQRKIVKQDKIIIVQPLSKVKDLYFLLKSYRQYFEPCPLSCFADSETPTRRKELTT